ncbi:MAG TPA: macro domain-containing protein [Pyrodictiaceae archaeon]|nr:macro domain-containing protein [Pyrodictiaceae archaeon]HIQ55889.1 macro domain-containing protein [Pyrodictium sp.]
MLGLRGPLARLECRGVVEVFVGDITGVEADAIVNPANSLMIMGGGVAGAIKRVAGDKVEFEARKRAPVPVGKAIVTGAGKLEPRIKAIIHAPTMERPAMPTTPEKVFRAAKAALEVAAQHGFESVAMPALGAGVGRVPVKDSIEKILEALVEHWTENSLPKKLVLVAYTDIDARQFVKAVEEFARKHRECRLEKS